ncbi:hypothetical protein [Maridesulfovibrio frigidus]|uniref:hypothetical protein n=1 Tax=Maridesulfovibrio frigidus TaxID=340956 RepID=UPI0012EC7487|nr:hypothetical protein [Maridesulfovibrio frigidus]
MTIAQKELAKKRRDLKRELLNIKKSIPSEKQPKKNQPAASTAIDLKAWISSKQTIDDSQFNAAEKFAKDKNMGILSAMLTLDIISVETYEEAKKVKFSQ